jgi:hypothetical protein
VLSPSFNQLFFAGLTMTDAAIRNALIDSYNNYAIGVDTKNWPLVRSCFADEVSLDYGELSDATVGTNSPCSSDDWVAILQVSINGFDITRHTMSNYRTTIDGDTAACIVYIDADHIILSDPAVNDITPQEIVKLVGEYTNGYKLINGQWKIVTSHLRVDWTIGNYGLFEQAQARAAT